MSLSKIEKLLVYVSVSIVLVQSLTWVFLCVIGIIVGIKKEHFFGINVESITYMKSIPMILEGVFLFNGYDPTIFDDQTVSSILFLIIQCIFLLANVGWSLSSALVFHKLHKQEPGFAKQFLNFGYYSICICIMDFIVAMMLFSDYSKCMKLIEGGIDGFLSGVFCANSFLLLGFIAFKGVILWIINLLIATFAIYTSKYLTLKAMEVDNSQNQPYVPQATPNQQNYQPSFNNNGYSNSPTSMQNVNENNNYYNANVPKPHGNYSDQRNEQQFPNSNFNRNNRNPEDYNNQNMDLRRGYMPDNGNQRQKTMSNQGQINSNYGNRDYSTGQDLRSNQNFAIERPKLVNQRSFNSRNNSMYN